MKAQFLFKSIFAKFSLLFLPVVLAGCIIEDGKIVSGTLRDVDCADGKVTVVTDEGKTFVLTINTPDCEAQQQAQQLKTGQEVEVKADDERRTVEKITVIEKTVVHETVIVGRVVNVQGEEVTVLKDDGDRVKVRVKPDKTKIDAGGKAEDGVQQLRQDVKVVINLDQETNVAQTVTIQNGAPAPDSGTPPPSTPEATPAEPEPTPAPAEPVASPTPEPAASPTPELEATPTPDQEVSPTPEGDETAATVRVRGVVMSVSESTVYIRSEDGQEITLSMTSETRIEATSEAEATLSEGDEVLIDFDSESNVAHKIEIQQNGATPES